MTLLYLLVSADGIVNNTCHHYYYLIYYIQYKVNTSVLEVLWLTSRISEEVYFWMFWITSKIHVHIKSQVHNSHHYVNVLALHSALYNNPKKTILDKNRESFCPIFQTNTLNKWGAQGLKMWGVKHTGEPLELEQSRNICMYCRTPCFLNGYSVFHVHQIPC